MKELKKAAKEINQVLEPKPAIKTVGIKKEKLEAELLDISEEVMEDDLSEETLQTLENLGAEFSWRNSDAKTDETDDEEDDEDELDDEKELDDEDDDDEPDDELEEEEEEEAPAKKEKKAPAKKEKKEKKAPAKKEKKYSRSQALIDALKEGGDRATLIQAIDDKYEENGGKPNPSGAATMINLHLPVLKLIPGLIEEKDGVIKLKTK
ncbi:MAG: hypothetical protein ACOC4J_06425 [Bacteroidota bacterium]